MVCLEQLCIKKSDKEKYVRSGYGTVFKFDNKKVNLLI